MNERASEPVLPRERLNGELSEGSGGMRVEPGDALAYDTTDAPPTMLAPRELDYLHWLGSRVIGTGRVVELGCFLGGSTAALDAGRRHAPAHGPFADASMLVYDAFEMPSDPRIVESWWMKPFGLAAGEDFLPTYRTLHTSRLHRLDLRKGWLPDRADDSELAALYPEREPIELLFVDAAKTWGVHTTILRAFARWMRPGSILVQQDFMDLLPWLSAHMWALRECFEPLDLVRGTPTLSFRCIADPSTRMHDACAQPSDFNQWSEAAEYWEHWLPGIGEAVVASHRCVHALVTGRPAEAGAFAERYEAWCTSGDSAHVYRSPFWRDWLARLPSSEDSDRLRACRAAREMMPSKDANAGGAMYDEARERAVIGMLDELERIHATRIALYGAGRHTRWLLSEDSPFARRRPRPDIVCIIDDAPPAVELRGIPIVTPADARAYVERIDAIVPSSDAHERAIVIRIHEMFGACEAPVVPIYTLCVDGTSPSNEARSQAPSAPVRVRRARCGTYCCGDCTAPSAPVRVRREHLETLAGYRQALGLRQQRAWLDAFAQAYVAPEWASGYVNHRDALLLWDLIEAIRPATIVEVGVASGVSTCVLAHAIAHLTPADQTTRIVSVDLDERCYFDRAHAVGAAIDGMPPELRAMIELRPGSTAVDAARSVPAGSVDFAFIDGDHRHPAPALDMIALLHALKPGAWVALHDIELPEIARRSRAEFQGASGASLLFHAWPFEKMQPEHEDPVLNNIGAVQMPANWQEAADALLALLRQPWEVGEPSTHLGELLSVPS